MNPIPDPLESRLARQPLKGAPSYLRRRILDSAPTAAHRNAMQRPAVPWHAGIPWSWVALGSVWAVAILGVRADRWLNGGAVATASVPTEQRLLARMQREELFRANAWEGSVPTTSRDEPGNPAPVMAPPPRSDRRIRPSMGSLGRPDESRSVV